MNWPFFHTSLYCKHELTYFSYFCVLVLLASCNPSFSLILWCSPHRTLLSSPCHIDLFILVVIFLISVQHTTREDFEKWWKKRKERKILGRPMPQKILEMGWEDAIFYHLQSKNTNRKVLAVFWGHTIHFEDWTATTKATSAAIFDTCKHLQNCGCTEELQIPFVARACVGNIQIPHPHEEHISKCGKLQIWSVTSHQAPLL